MTTFKAVSKMTPHYATMISPKQSPLDKVRDWYPFYAGFTETFAAAVLTSHLKDVRSVLDPWNGSGTTTAVSAKLGIPSVGIDINPALTVIARGRLLPYHSDDGSSQTAHELLATAQALQIDFHHTDQLSTWMKHQTSQRIRALHRAIHILLAPNIPFPDPTNVNTIVGLLSPKACFFYTALFATVRDLLRPFLASNPTWFKSPSASNDKITTSWRIISERFLLRVQYFQTRLKLAPTDLHVPEPSFITASSDSLMFDTGTFGGVLTSPPYATRIDYVVGTQPELAVLNADESLITTLRASMTGSPIVAGREHNHANHAVVSDYGLDIVDQIGHHPSKGSKHYYRPWIRNYILDLQTILREICRTVNAAGPICIVVQDSYYKSLHINLQRIVTETIEAFGRTLIDRYDFPVGSLRSRMNPRASKHLPTRRNFETLLVFGMPGVS